MLALLMFAPPHMDAFKPKPIWLLIRASIQPFSVPGRFICIGSMIFYLQSLISFISYSIAQPSNSQLFHLQLRPNIQSTQKRDVKGLHFQNVDCTWCSILHTSECKMDIKSTIASARIYARCMKWRGKLSFAYNSFGLLTWFIVGLSGGSLWITIW